jgi:hypothetical protein
MALNDELITITDVRSYRDVDSSYDSTRFSGFLKEVQEGELMDLLGDALWLDFFKNTADTKYAELLNGKEYTYQGETVLFPGLKPYLVWGWLSKLPLEGNVHHTQSGDVSYLRDVTANPSKSALSQAKENYKKNILIERNKIVQFLDTESATYPLWDYTGKQNESNYQFNII